MENLFFQPQMDESHFLEEIRKWEHPPRYGIVQFKERVKYRFSWRIRRVSSTTSRLISGCRWSDKRLLVHVGKLHISPSRWTKSQTSLVERRIIPHSTKIHWGLQNYSYKLGCYARKPHRWPLEHRWVKRFVWFLDRFYSIYSIGRKTSRRIYVVQEETDKKAANIQARSFMARTLEIKMEEMHAKLKEKAEVVWHEKLKTRIMHRKLARNLFHWPGGQGIQRDHQECSQEVGNTKLLLFCLARQARKELHGRPVVHPTRSRSKFACILEASESTRLRMEEFFTESSWGPYCRKGRQFICNIIIWYTNLFLCLKLWKFPQQRQQWIKEWEKLEKISAWNLTKVRSKKEVIDEARTKGAKVHFASLMDICHLNNAELEAKHQKYKGRVVFRGDIVKDDSGFYAVFTEQGSSASQMTAAKSHGYHIQTARMRMDKQLMQYLFIPRYKWKMLTNCWKFPNRNVQTFVFVHHDTNGLNHCPVWKTQSFLLSEICTVILWQDCYGKSNLRKSYWSKVGRRFPIGNAYSYTLKKGYSYLCMYMTSNWLERKKTLFRCGKYSIKKLIWENQHLSLIMYNWDVFKDNVK